MDFAKFQVSRLHCVIGGNQSAGQHMAGYNGVHALMAPGQRRSAFVPQYAGLNLEHYFDGFHDLRDKAVRFEPRLALPLSPEIQRSMYASMSSLRYEQPYYYGVCRGYMILLMFDCKHPVRFCHSPSGGGEGNPAWDFYMLAPECKVGKEYGLRARLCYKPFISRRDATAEFAAWKKSLEGGERCG